MVNQLLHAQHSHFCSVRNDLSQLVKEVVGSYLQGHSQIFVIVFIFLFFLRGWGRCGRRTELHCQRARLNTHLNTFMSMLGCRSVTSCYPVIWTPPWQGKVKFKSDVTGYARQKIVAVLYLPAWALNNKPKIISVKFIHYNQSPMHDSCSNNL